MVSIRLFNFSALLLSFCSVLPAVSFADPGDKLAVVDPDGTLRPLRVLASIPVEGGSDTLILDVDGRHHAVHDCGGAEQLWSLVGRWGEPVFRQDANAFDTANYAELSCDPLVFKDINPNEPIFVPETYVGEDSNYYVPTGSADEYYKFPSDCSYEFVSLLFKLEGRAKNVGFPPENPTIVSLDCVTVGQPAIDYRLHFAEIAGEAMPYIAFQLARYESGKPSGQIWICSVDGQRLDENIDQTEVLLTKLRDFFVITSEITPAKTSAIANRTECLDLCSHDCDEDQNWADSVRAVTAKGDNLWGQLSENDARNWLIGCESEGGFIDTFLGQTLENESNNWNASVLLDLRAAAHSDPVFQCPEPKVVKNLSAARYSFADLSKLIRDAAKSAEEGTVELILENDIEIFADANEWHLVVNREVVASNISFIGSGGQRTVSIRMQCAEVNSLGCPGSDETFIDLFEVSEGKRLAFTDVDLEVDEFEDILKNNPSVKMAGVKVSGASLVLEGASLSFPELNFGLSGSSAEIYCNRCSVAAHDSAVSAERSKLYIRGDGTDDAVLRSDADRTIQLKQTSNALFANLTISGNGFLFLGDETGALAEDVDFRFLASGDELPAFQVNSEAENGGVLSIGCGSGACTISGLPRQGFTAFAGAGLLQISPRIEFQFADQTNASPSDVLSCSAGDGALIFRGENYCK